MSSSAPTGRVLFVNRFFHPDLSATSQMLSDLAFALADAGVDVHVLCSRMRYDDPGARLPPEQTLRGVHVHRVATSRLGRRRTAARLIDYLTFYASVLVAIARRARRGDTLVVKTDPPLLSIVVVPLARWRGARVVHWCQDLFPEVATAAGLRLGPPWLDRSLMRLLGALRDRAHAASSASVAIGERMRERLLERLPAHPVALIPNWADADAVVPLAHEDNPLRREWALEDRLVVAYSGNMGVAHPFEAVLDAAERLADDPRIAFLFIGGGARRAWLGEEVERRGLGECVRFAPYQPRERLAESLGAGDLHLVTLAPSMEGLIVPSKFYGIAAAARPTLFVGDTDGEIAREIARHGCGTSIDTDDGAALAAAIRDYADDPERRRREGEAARRLVLERHTIAGARDAWLALLADPALPPTARQRPRVRTSRPSSPQSARSAFGTSRNSARPRANSSSEK